MKIATWNIQRLEHKRELAEMKKLCVQACADVFVLTESDTQFALDYKSCLRTSLPTDTERSIYKSSERRVEIYSNYEIVSQHETFDEQTAVCAELLTERGSLLVYGVIIGVQGSRDSGFKADLPRILDDIERLACMGKPICVCGDFNITFSDNYNYYYTKAGRTALEESFKTNNLLLLTRNQPQCIDHIAISRGFVGDADVRVEEWNHNKKLSDHKGICVELTFGQTGE
jgi:endonuclease/exonuclease/phosphatase family metal-dependent hydrolase